MALGFSATLLLFFLTTRLFRSFQLNGHDIIFILLPAGILGVKCLLEMLLSSESPPGRTWRRKISGLFFQAAGKNRPRLVSVFAVERLLLRALHQPDAAGQPAHGGHGFVEDGRGAARQSGVLLLEPWINPWLTDFLPGVFFVRFHAAGRRAVFLSGAGENDFSPGDDGLSDLDADGHRQLSAGARHRAGKFFCQSIHPRTARTRHQSRRGLHHAGRPGGLRLFSLAACRHSAVLALYLYRHRRKFFIPALVYVALMCCATIYLRYHYLVDVIAAFSYAPAACWLNDFLLARWPGEQITVVCAGNKE